MFQLRLLRGVRIYDGSDARVDGSLAIDSLTIDPLTIIADDNV